MTTPADIPAPAELGKIVSSRARVYVIAAEDAVKVGVAKIPAQRLRELQTGNHQRLNLFDSIDCAEQDPIRVEQMAHALLREKRRCGEWFAVSPEEAREAVAEALALVGRGISMPIDPRKEAGKISAKQPDEEFHPPQSKKLPTDGDLILLRIMLAVAVRSGDLGGRSTFDTTVSELNEHLGARNVAAKLTTMQVFGEAVSRIMLFWVDYSPLAGAEAYRNYCLYPQTKVFSGAALDWKAGTFSYSIAPESILLMRNHGVYTFFRFVEARINEARLAQVTLERAA